ncbi:MAG: DUF6777 domain-containing protein [Armatimonadota bacterium]
MNEHTVARRKTIVRRSIAAAAVTTAAIIFGGVVVAEKHHYPTAPDSFLMYQVDSTSELVEALKADPALRLRYARHFGIPENQVIDFVKNALVPYQLPAARNLTVYGVSKSGRIYPVRTRLPKGTKVWATRSGEPVLKWLCANPLTKKLPGTKLAKARTTKVSPKTKVAAAGELAPVPMDADLPIAAEPMLSLPPVVTTALTTPSVPVAMVPSDMISAPGPVTAKANYGLLFPVGLVLLSTLNGGSGGTGGAISPALPPVPGPGASVEAPEPGSVALMIAAGIPLLGALYRRRRSK